MFLLRWCLLRRHKRVKFYDHKDTDVPVFSMPLNELKEGVCLKIFGFMPENCEKFAIHLTVDNRFKDIALRLNPRLPQSYVDRNARIWRRWGKPETASKAPFVLVRGRFFRIHILTTNLNYLIALNGMHFAEFQHRIAFNKVKFVKIYGDVCNIHVTQAEVTAYPERIFLRKFEDLPRMLVKRSIEMAKCEKRFDRCVKTLINLPFYGLVPKSYRWNQRHLRFEGRVKLLPISFTIKLQIGQNVWPHPNVPFHFSYHFLKYRNNLNKSMVVRKAWDKGACAIEETKSVISDLGPGKAFSLVIAPLDHAIEVFINKKFAAAFGHHTDYRLVDTVYVDGDIKLTQVTVEYHHSEVYVSPKRRSSAFAFLDLDSYFYE